MEIFLEIFVFKAGNTDFFALTRRVDKFAVAQVKAHMGDLIAASGGEKNKVASLDIAFSDHASMLGLLRRRTGYFDAVALEYISSQTATVKALRGAATINVRHTNILPGCF